MPCIITLTSESLIINGVEYDYHKYDRILKNINKKEYEVFYSGQNQGKLDYQLIKAIQNNELFKVYYRAKDSMPYTYLGFTYSSNIIQYRELPINVNTNTEQRLQIHLIIKNIENISIPINNFSGPGKYKKDVLIHAGLRDVNYNLITEHNKSTNIGFYYY